jgi:uncharacterized protein YchJ
MMAHDVFISYSSKDKPISDAVCSMLEQEKIRCWIAPRDVVPGKNYAACITEAIKSSRVMVVIFSNHSNVSGPVTNELEIATKYNVVIIPFRIEDISPSAELEYYLSSRHWLDAITPPVERHISMLAEIINFYLMRKNVIENDNNAAPINRNSSAIEAETSNPMRDPIKDGPPKDSNKKNTANSILEFCKKKKKFVFGIAAAFLIVVFIIIFAWHNIPVGFLNTSNSQGSYNTGTDRQESTNMSNDVSSVPAVERESTGTANISVNASSPSAKTDSKADAGKSSSSSVTSNNIDTKTTMNDGSNDLTDNPQSNWIFYSNAYDNFKIYKMREDGSEKHKLVDDVSLFIRESGEWVYYCNRNDGDKLYKAKLDGSDRQKVNDEETVPFIVSGDSIYYCSGSDNGKIYIINTDGSNKRKLSDDGFGYFILLDGWIYYNNLNDMEHLYRIKLDGSIKEKIIDEGIGCFAISDEWIYYCNGEDGLKIYRVKTDGSGRQMLCQDKPSEMVVSGNWLYYADQADGGKIYKMKTNGEDRQKLNDEKSLFISVLNEWVYYYNQDGYFKMKTDGSLQQRAG